jgi:hypothetical protein
MSTLTVGTISEKVTDAGVAVDGVTLKDGGATFTSAVDVTGAVGITGNTTVTSGNLVIGTSGNGIDFSATSDASGMTSELLDSYEEGSWTPAQNGVTASASSGFYTKVGRVVTATMTMTTATTSNTNSMQISGLPFTCASIDGNCAKGYDNYAVTNNSQAYVPNGTTYIQLTQNSSASSTNAVHSGKLLKICAIYYSAT